MCLLSIFRFGLNVTSLMDVLSIQASLVTFYIVNIAISGSVYVTTALTIDRCYAVVKPLRWSSVFTRFRIKLVLITISIWCVIFNTPAYFISNNMQDSLDQNDSSISNRIDNVLVEKSIFYRYIHPAINTVIPVLLVSVCNCLILLKVKRRKKEFAAIARTLSRGNDENGLTVQVLCVSILTILSRILHAASTIIIENWDGELTPHVFNKDDGIVIVVEVCVYGNFTEHTPDNDVFAVSYCANLTEQHVADYQVSKVCLYSNVTEHSSDFKFLELSYCDGLSENADMVFEENNYFAFVCLYITSFFVIVNSATNFIFYCYFGRKFRKVLTSMCSNCLGHKSTTQTTETGRVSAAKISKHKGKIPELTNLNCERESVNGDYRENEDNDERHELKDL